MTVYADTSALARAYFEDEPEQPALWVQLFESGESVATATFARVELARAVSAKRRAGRPIDVDIVSDHCWANVSTLDIEPGRHLSTARELVQHHRLGTLDAIHLAVALDVRDRLDPEVVLVTRDEAQAEAAQAEGLPVG